MALRLIESLGAPYGIDGNQINVAVTIGITIAPTDGTEPEVLMKNADLALCRAKADGGATYRYFEPELDARMRERRILELDLHKAIAGREFELYYQPVVDIRSGQIISCEALLRWHHPERGLVSPADFIPIAEEIGLIVPLGEWVLRDAMKQAVCWPKHVAIAVNVSPAQSRNRTLWIWKLLFVVEELGLDASRLELEITEQVLLEDNQWSREIPSTSRSRRKHCDGCHS